MKIRVAILDKDDNYKNRILSAFQVKYADKIELYIFSETAQLMSALETQMIDMVLVDDEIEITEYPEKIVFVYLCKSIGVEEIHEHPAICKFQKVDTIYKQILGIYADTNLTMKLRTENNEARVVAFMSAQGGSGVSTAAAAYALKRASEHKQIFYLNLERFGGTDLYFSGDGIMSFSEVIYALKSKKANLIIKLESNMKTDRSGVDFFSECKNAYDMFELNDEEVVRLIQGISKTKEYDEIIIDVSEGFHERTRMLLEDYADRVVYVSDGSKNGNQKFEHFCQVIRLMEQRNNKKVFSKLALLYNRYSSKTSTQLMESPIQVLGGIHRYEGIDGRKLIEEIAKADALENV